jgi:hypothetical protein
MPAWNLGVDGAEVTQLAADLAAAMGQREWITAQAMTKAAAKTRRTLSARIYPQVEGGPNTWTRRGLITSIAKPNDLRVMVGWQFGAGRFEDSEKTRGPGGTPAGRYMSTNVRGGTRGQKSTERLLAGRGVVRPGTGALIPNANDANPQGNFSGAAWRAVAKGVAASGAKGLLPPAQEPGGKRRRRKKQPAWKTDYFVMKTQNDQIVNRYSTGGTNAFIAKREGRKKRGFKVVMWIIDKPSYRRRFNVDKIAMQEFAKGFKKEFEDGVVKEIRRRKRKKSG